MVPTLHTQCFEDKESFTKEVSIYRTEGLQHENVLKYLDSIQVQCMLFRIANIIPLFKHSIHVAQCQDLVG